MSESRPVVQLPGGPPADAPIPSDPVDGVDLQTYALISAHLAEGVDPRDRVLHMHRLDETRWLHIEQTHLLRIASATLRGDRSRAEEFDRLYLEAQDALGPVEPSRPLDRYAQLVARIERGDNPGLVAKQDGLSLADFGRLSRAWTRRLAQDAAMSRQFREWVQHEKVSSGGASGR